jgi:transketolase
MGLSFGGVSIGEDGPSQMALEDIAIFRAVHSSAVLYLERCGIGRASCGDNGAAAWNQLLAHVTAKNADFIQQG